MGSIYSKGGRRDGRWSRSHYLVPFFAADHHDAQSQSSTPPMNRHCPLTVTRTEMMPILLQQLHAFLESSARRCSPILLKVPVIALDDFDGIITTDTRSYEALDKANGTGKRYESCSLIQNPVLKLTDRICLPCRREGYCLVPSCSTSAPVDNLREQQGSSPTSFLQYYLILRDY